MDRDIIAYAIGVLMALAAVAFVLHHWYFSHERSYRRRLRREYAA